MEEETLCLEVMSAGFQAMRLAKDIFNELKARVPVETQFWCSVGFQGKVVEQVLRDPRVVRYPPAAQYVLRFLKAYIQEIEDQSEELADELMETYFLLMESAPKKPEEGGPAPPPCYRTFRWSHKQGHEIQRRFCTVRVLQQFHEVGMTTWPCGFFLAEYVLSNPKIVESKRCFEAGAGVGFTSVVINSLNPTYLWTTDYGETVMQNLEENLKINNLNPIPKPVFTGGDSQEGHVYVSEYDWEVILKDATLFEKLPAVDAVFVADCIYDPTIIKPLISALEALICRNAYLPVIYLAQTIRNPTTWETFVSSLQKSKLTMLDIPIDATPQLFPYERKGVVLKRISSTLL